MRGSDPYKALIDKYMPKAAPRPPLGPVQWFLDATVQADGDYLIKGLLDRGILAMIYGESGTGKSFFTLDLALHVAAGLPWRGLKVRQAPVLYVAAEGGRRFANRLVAAKITQPWNVLDEILLGTLTQPLDLFDPKGDTDALIELLLATAAEQFIDPLGLLVLDTLARVMGGGNESATEDMGVLLGNLERIQAATGATVLLIHHPGKDLSRGARGSSALRAGLDTEIQIENRTGVRRVEVTKQRDWEMGQVYGYELCAIELGVDEDGDPISSCILSLTDPPEKAVRLNPIDATVLELLGSGGYVTSAEIIAKTGGTRPTVYRRLQSMAKAGLIQDTVAGWSLVR